IFRTFNEVGIAVSSATSGAQQPWLSLSPIRGAFYFISAPPTLNPSLSLDGTPDAAAQAWSVIQNTTSTAVLEAFLGRFGTTAYGDMARARLDELKKSQLAIVAPPVVLPKPSA